MFFDLLRATATAIIFLFLVEVGLRATGTYFTASFYESDPVMGFVMRPHAAGWYTVESDNFIQLNGDGFHDPEISFNKPANTFRVAVIGASEVANVSLPPDQSLTHYIESGLSSCGSFSRRHVQVLNFGVPSFTLAQEYLLLEHRVWQYHPDLVLLAFTVGSGVPNNIRRISVVGSKSPYFAYINGQLVEDRQSYVDTAIDPARVQLHNLLADVANRFQVLGLLNWTAIDFSRDLHNLLPTHADRPAPGSALFWCFLPPQTPELREAWHITEGLLDLMNRSSVQHGSEFWISTLDESIQDTPDLAAREAVKKRLGAPDLFYTDRRIASIASGLGIREDMIAPRLADYTAAHPVSIHGFIRTEPNEGHLNATGNRLAGGLIAGDLCQSYQSRGSR